MPDTPPDHPLYGYRIVGGMFERLLGCSVYFRLATPEEAALIAQRPRPTANILDVLDQRKRPPRLRAGRATGRRRNRPGLQRSRGHAPKTAVRRSGLNGTLLRDHIIAPRREHSRKPDCVRDELAELLDGPRCELFARSRHPASDCWGDEVGKFDEPEKKEAAA